MKKEKINSGPWKQVFQGNVFAFGLVSFLNDLSTEMIYPLLPVFFSGLVPPATVAVYIGLMEGLAEATASLLKFYAGHLSDRFKRRKPLALAGYAISSAVRPFTAIAGVGWQVVALRLGDRIGKGIRTAPRDALLSESVTRDVRGRAFSFHRLMDHAGAVTGPLVAAAFLYLMLGRDLLWHHGNNAAGPEEMAALRWLFALAALPGLAATISLWRLVQEKNRPAGTRDLPKEGRPLRTPRLSSRFFIFLLAVVLFTLGNSSDLFLIFYAQTRFGLGLGWVISLWVLLHLAKILFSLPGGWLADRVGRRAAIITGWVIYAAVYIAMPFASHFGTVCTLLLCYGVYYGMTEGAERALVADFVPAKDRGKAYGWYHGAVGLATLPASLLFGVFWARLGPKVAFLVGASLAAGALLVLTCCFSGRKNAPARLHGNRT
ncbi:MAG: MFS transporter [Desulfobacterales bacterium]|nr:MFS transporter [Desulfobacterales bacterium]